MSRHPRLALSVIGMAVALVLAAGGPALGQLDILSGKPLKRSADGASTGIVRPEDVVSVSAEFAPPAHDGQPGTLSITADIKPPWYTYAITQKPVLATPTTIKLDPSSDYQLAGDWQPNLPPTIKQLAGDTFETHAPSVTWQAPLEIKPGVDPSKLEIAGRVRIQVCHDSCLRPTEFPFVAQVVSKPAAEKPKPTGIFQPQRGHVTWRGRLEPQTATPGTTVKLLFTAEPAGNWHIYNVLDRDPRDLGYKPTLIVLTKTGPLKSGRAKTNDPLIEVPADIPGGEAQRYHAERVTWIVPITIPADAKMGDYPIEGLVGYQTCSGATCDLPSGLRFEATLTVAPTAGKQAAPLAIGEALYKDAAKAADQRPLEVSAAAPPVEGTDKSLLVMLALSLAGGFVLNFMPCVLPVIGLKILSFAEQAGRSRSHILALNIWYSLGLLSVFMVLATLSSAVNLGLNDTNLHWGQQFSSTAFNVTMVAIVFVMALSFLGVWEIPIPGFVGSGRANEIAMHEGAVGAFAKGVITTVLATPCSGPLLGAVFGYTLKQPPGVTYAIFASIGLGMAAPYLLIGAFPSLIRVLPKPGAWMETFKHMMGFLMLGTIVFFFSFMNRDYLVPTFALMIGLWAACWWIGRVSIVEPLGRRLKAWAQGIAVATVVGLAAFTWLTPRESLIAWKGFSQAELTRLTDQGKTVLVDFTAEWCPNCKYNLRYVIETPEVRELLDTNKIVPLLADWTDGSPEITETLESLQSASIPVLAIYAPQRPPIVLRDVLTRQQVIDALNQAGAAQTATTASKSLAVTKP